MNKFSEMRSMLASCVSLLCMMSASAGCQSLKIVGGTASPSASSSLSAADQQALSDVPTAAQYLHNGSLPISLSDAQHAYSQPGLAVCAPVVASSDDALTQFGAGCAYWAQLIIASRPELGSTPSRRGITRSTTELGIPMSALTLQQAMQLRQTVSVPYAAVGMLNAAQTAGQYSLAYTVVRTSDGTAVGTPISLTGTREQIISQLPQLATAFWRAVGVTNIKPLPTAPTLTGDEMQQLGALRWTYTADDSLAAMFGPLATQRGNAFLSLAQLQSDTLSTPQQQAAAIDAAMAAMPHNAAAYMEAATFYPQSMQDQASDLRNDLIRFPNNYQYAAAYAKMARETSMPTDAQLAAVQVLLLAAPKNPDAWNVAGRTYAEIADGIRQARASDAMSPEEQAQVAKLYPYSLGCYEQAALLDPLDADAWTEVAESASFNGNGDEADAALRRALSSNRPDPYDAYSWGMQMYQDKWYGTQYPGKLQAVIDLACADSRLSASDLKNLADYSFSASNQPQLYQQLLSASQARAR